MQQSANQKKFFLAALTMILGVLAMPSQAFASDPIYTSLFSNKAVGGYDTVSYFQGDGTPVKGSQDFQTEWRGANWYFSSQENLNLFKADPLKYAPQYGGYCAWATAHDTLAKGDPEVYFVQDDKLYLNINENIGGQWEARKEELIPVSDKAYPELVDLK